MKILIQNMVRVLALFFAVAAGNCRAETVLDIPRKEAESRVKSGDIAFIFDAAPARMAELSKIDPALPFYAGLLIEAEDAEDERAELLFIEALASPAVRDAALSKLSAKEDVLEGASGGETETGGPLAAGRAALARRDYNEALRRFRELLGGGAEPFISDKDLLGDLGKAFQFAVIPGVGAAAAAGAELFLEWEGDVREGNRLWALPEDERDKRRYLLLYYAGRMKRQLADYGAAADLFSGALALAPDSEQSDACIWYILDTSLVKNGKDPAEIAALIKKYAPLWTNPAYFSDLFERFTHLLCLYRRWDELAGLFPYIRGYCGPEVLVQHAFILGNVVELGFLPQEAAASALETIRPDGGREKAEVPPLPADFYRIAYESDVVAGLDTRSFYYTSSAAKKLGEEPRLNFPENADGGEAARSERHLTSEFLYGFFRFGAARFAYPYIMEEAAELPVQELRVLAELLAEAERWGDSIRLARTYMQRPSYSADLADLAICYPLAYAPLVERFSRETGMEEALLYGLVRTESLFIPDIVSRAGATGLTQLMPETAREMAGRLTWSGGPDYFTEGEFDLRDPALNINLGALYFQRLKEQTGSTLLALLSYNGGMNRIRRWREARPALNDELFLESVEYAETRDYGRQVLTAAEIYRCLDRR
jgi:soluble lytic murein transglycosylase